MAVTFGQMAARILRETARDISFQTAVEDSIISAIKELERAQFWLFQKEGTLTLTANSSSVALPTDFVSLSTARLLVDTTYYTERNGFVPVTFNDLRSYSQLQGLTGIPCAYTLYGNDFVFYPAALDAYTVEIWYFYKDETYPVNYDDTSIWLGDLTADLTRYKALAMFYRDELQAEEKAQYYESKSQDAITQLKIRNNQRQTVNRLSI